MKNVSLYIWRNKAYLPTPAQFQSGLFVATEPVIICSIEIDDLTKAVKLIKDIEHQILPDPKTHNEFLALGNPILTATGARSWKQLAKTGFSYNIRWTTEHILIEMTRVNKNGVWEFDSSKTKLLEPDTPIKDIVEMILDDLHTRPGFSA